jgi:multiple sugar transport system ATP-binding protein
MNVYDNIAFPMRSKLHKKSEEEIKTAVDRILKMLKIDGFEERKPAQLSNGQKQRVAIGRCLVRDPAVFLMDEPLAHLDAKLRHEMRSELKEMQHAFNTTTIYVTHDYMEAMSLADRIAIINKGKLEQIGSALDMYYLPKNRFIATLFGEPEINIFPADMTVQEGNVKFKVPGTTAFLDAPADAGAVLKEEASPEMLIGIRGVDISFTFSETEAKSDSGASPWIQSSVYAFEPIGNKVIMTVMVGADQVRVTAPNETQADLDQKVWIKLNMTNALFFRKSTEDFITRANIGRYQ